MELFRVDTTDVVNRLTTFLKNYLNQANLDRYVIGLSGGLDSSVSAVLAVKAVGAEKVLGILMPYSTSSESSLVDALSMVDILGIEHIRIPISPFADAYTNSNRAMSDLRKGNVMARMRMVVLYDIAAKNKGLVLGTSNKTEALLGYGTIHGDVAWDINPLWDLYKTQVWELAKFLEIPQNIIEKAPTADLRSGQTDEDELGFKYSRVDHLLFNLVDLGYDNQKLISEGFTEDEIKRAQKLIKNNQFKRSGPAVARLYKEYPGCEFIAPDNW
ncbi:MAG: NAD+ synthase [candidate division Zixibacteria bacterium]|nr:NAD+ synthase [candidate division Zixibacteria bacterium]